MLARLKKSRDNSGHSVHANKINALDRPELVSRVFRTRDKKCLQTSHGVRDSALDCGAPAKRPMSPARRTVA